VNQSVAGFGKKIDEVDEDVEIDKKILYGRMEYLGRDKMDRWKEGFSARVDAPILAHYPPST
jgi:hypothetical protein